MLVVAGLKGICTACTAKYKKKVSTTKITLMYCNMKNATINSFENLAVHAVQFSFFDVGSSHFFLICLESSVYEIMKQIAFLVLQNAGRCGTIVV